MISGKFAQTICNLKLIVRRKYSTVVVNDIWSQGLHVIICNYNSKHVYLHNCDSLCGVGQCFILTNHSARRRQGRCVQRQNAQHWNITESGVGIITILMSYDESVLNCSINLPIILQLCVVIWSVEMQAYYFKCQEMHFSVILFLHSLSSWYADRSEAVVLMVFLLCVTLWVLLQGFSCWVLLPLCSRVCSVLLALWSPRFGKSYLKRVPKS